MPDGYEISDNALAAKICMYRTVVLDAAVSSDSYSAHVSAQHSVLPDAAAFADFNVAYQSSSWGDIRAWADLGLGSSELDQRHLERSSSTRKQLMKYSCK
jgi:hypothetical protein